MDENQNTNNNVATTYCAHCGALNNKTSLYCINCGSPLTQNSEQQVAPVVPNQPVNNTQPLQQVNNTQPAAPEKEKNPYTAIMIILGIASIVLCLFVEQAIAVVSIAAIASLFSKTTRPYGITVFSAFASVFVIGVVLMIILFGMCFAGLGTIPLILL